MPNVGAWLCAMGWARYYCWRLPWYWAAAGCGCCGQRFPGFDRGQLPLIGVSGFQKRADGRLTPAARWLYAPYLACAWVNSRLWTRKHPQPDLIVDNVWLGRIPTTGEQRSFASIVDLCAELPTDPQGRAYVCVPVLDLIAPTPMNA